jgi:hypothetical protein
MAADDVDLYLLKAEKLTDPKTIEKFSAKYGNFTEKDIESVLFCVHDGSTLVFSFKQMYMQKWKDLKDARVGRVLPPHITRIQQRHAAYLQRPGLPRVPLHAIPEKPAKTPQPAASQGGMAQPKASRKASAAQNGVVPVKQLSCTPSMLDDIRRENTPDETASSRSEPPTQGTFRRIVSWAAKQVGTRRY